MKYDVIVFLFSYFFFFRIEILEALYVNYIEIEALNVNLLNLMLISHNFGSFGNWRFLEISVIFGNFGRQSPCKVCSFADFHWQWLEMREIKFLLVRNLPKLTKISRNRFRVSLQTPVSIYLSLSLILSFPFFIWDVITCLFLWLFKKKI